MVTFLIALDGSDLDIDLGDSSDDDLEAPEFLVDLEKAW